MRAPRSGSVVSSEKLSIAYEPARPPRSWISASSRIASASSAESSSATRPLWVSANRSARSRASLSSCSTASGPRPSSSCSRFQFAASSFSSAVALTQPRLAAGRRFPELEPGALGIDRPSEAPLIRLLEGVDHLDAGRAQLGEHRVQVGDAEVHHERLLRPSEVLGVRVEDSPDRGATRGPFEWLAAPVG